MRFETGCFLSCTIGLILFAWIDIGLLAYRRILAWLARKRRRLRERRSRARQRKQARIANQCLKQALLKQRCTGRPRVAACSVWASVVAELKGLLVPGSGAAQTWALRSSRVKYRKRERLSCLRSAAPLPQASWHGNCCCCRQAKCLRFGFRPQIANLLPEATLCCH